MYYTCNESKVTLASLVKSASVIETFREGLLQEGRNSVIECWLCSPGHVRWEDIQLECVHWSHSELCL